MSGCSFDKITGQEFPIRVALAPPSGRGNFLSFGAIPGHYGAGCWWVPLTDDTGLKVYHSLSKRTLQEAISRNAQKEEARNFLLSKASKSLPYLPRVLSSGAAHFVGIADNYMFLRGYSKEKVLELDCFIPCLIMERYDIPPKESLTEDAKAKMFSAFDEDGLAISPNDSWDIRQIGVDKTGHFRLLDIVIDKVKIL